MQPLIDRPTSYCGARGSMTTWRSPTPVACSHSHSLLLSSWCAKSQLQAHLVLRCTGEHDHVALAHACGLVALPQAVVVVRAILTQACSHISRLMSAIQNLDCAPNSSERSSLRQPDTAAHAPAQV